MLLYCGLFILVFLPVWTESSLLDKRLASARDTTRCDKDEVACLDQRRCIPKARVCDNQQDCIDNSDEMECENSCRGDAFRCNNGKCIPRKWICDSFDDCGDSSDEIYHCLGIERLPCSQDAYRCEEGPCISLGQVCDGKVNCPRGDDENRCQDHIRDPAKEANATPRENTIGESKRQSDWFFKPENTKTRGYSPVNHLPSPSAVSSSSSISSLPSHLSNSFEPYGSLEPKASPKKLDYPQNLMSDRGVALTHEPLHLVDPAAETHPNSNDHSTVNKDTDQLMCADYEFKCADNLRCIPRKSRCDQRYDCVDQSDEKHCSIDPCVFGLFRCHSGKCAISSWRCNATDWTGRRVTVLSKDFEAFL
ncbi:sortilin-related receptor [Tetranychus urticae]|uniref:Uncharacterized protein n=1 Tax=Tetranychus urticae TaxID=32264 RepID=T1L140_TETUR|nr:sortilin-related receptor [Tetranychus urticae]